MFFSAKDLVRILSSTALSNGFLVALSLGLGYSLSTAQYAEFVVAVSAFAIASLVLDFGLNISAIRRAGSGECTAAPSMFATVKLVLAVMVLTVSATLIAFNLVNPIPAAVFGVICAAFNNVWLALRVVEQSNGDTKAFFRANLVLFFFRLFAVTGVYVSELPAVHYLLALYFYPYLPLLISQASVFHVRRQLFAFSQDIGQIFAYTKWVFLSAVLFVLSVQLPVMGLRVQGRDEELAVFGLAMTVASFSTWMSYSLKPFFLGRFLSNQKTSDKKFWQLSALFSGAILPLGLLVWWAFDEVYGHKYAQVGLTAAIIFLYTTLVFVFGLYNSKVHVHGRPEVETTINGLRALSVALIVWWVALPVHQLVVVIGLATVLFELVLLVVNIQLVQKLNENSVG